MNAIHGSSRINMSYLDGHAAGTRPMEFVEQVRSTRQDYGFRWFYYGIASKTMPYITI